MVTHSYRLRKAELWDAIRTLSWRNHPSIRAESTSPKLITAEEHHEWFLDQRFQKWIFTEDEKATGVCVYGNEGWSFYLDPHCPPRSGLGLIMLALFTKVLKDQKIETIRAQVKTANEASIALHRALGFKQTFTRGEIVYLEKSL